MEPAASDAGTGLAAKRSELAEVPRRTDGLIRAIEEGLYEPSMKARMQGLERRREVLEVEPPRPPSRSRGCIRAWSRVHRQKVATLHDALAAENGHEAREAIRALVEAIVLVPEDGTLAIEMRGDLAAILALGQNAGTRREGRVHKDLLVQVKLVGSVPEIAEAEKISKSYVSRILRLALLAPDIVEAILGGWADQRVMLERLERLDRP